MAITVNLRYTGAPGAARAFVEEMLQSGTVQKIKDQPGNLRYEYFQSLEDENTVLLIDSWVDQESIDKHHASAMMETLGQLREKYDLHMSVQRYQDADTPEGEDKFIRA